MPPAEPARRAGDKLEISNDDFVHGTPGGAGTRGMEGSHRMLLTFERVAVALAATAVAVLAFGAAHDRGATRHT